MYVIADDAYGPWEEVFAKLEADESPDRYPMQGYVAIEEHGGEGWLAEVVAAFWERPQVLGPLDASMLAAQEHQHGLLVPGEAPPVLLAMDVHRIAKLRLLKGYRAGRAVTMARRPSVRGAARCRPLSPEETARLLELPEAIDRVAGPAAGTTNIIGVLARQPTVPLAVARDAFPFHFLVAGSTGSIKSNVAANLAHQAACGGRAVLIHDRKPDYGKIDRPNADPNPLVLEAWPRFAPFGLRPRAAPDVVRYRLFDGQPPAGPGVRLVGFRSSDFDPEVFAGLFFSDDESNERAVDGLVTLLSRLRDAAGPAPPVYDVETILQEVDREDQGDRQAGRRNPSGLLHHEVAQKLRRALFGGQRRFPWLDAVGRALPPSAPRAYGSAQVGGGPRVEAFALDDVLVAGRLSVFDYGRPSAATYGVVASYLFEAGQAARTRLAATGAGPGLVQLFDEAHLLFSTGGRHGAGLARVFGQTLVQARSKDHCVLCVLQNVASLPHEVRNNLRNQLILKQGDRRMAEAATEAWGRDAAAQAMSLEGGDGLVAFWHMTRPVLASLAPSPFELERDDRPAEAADPDHAPFTPRGATSPGAREDGGVVEAAQAVAGAAGGGIP